MPATPHSLLRRLRRLAGQSTYTPSDASLLERFVQARDEDAFAAMVERQGPMVLGVCQRLLEMPTLPRIAFRQLSWCLPKRLRAFARARIWPHGCMVWLVAWP